MDPERLRRAALLAAVALAAPAFPGCASAPPPGSPAVDSAAAPSGAGVDARGRPRHPKDLRFPEQAFVLRRTDRVVLSNGMVVHLLEDHTLPLVDASAVFRGGSVFDPEGKEGLAGLACALVRSGGTTTLKPEALDDELDMLAGSVSVGGGMESCGASFSFLSRDVARGLQVFADVLRNPGFDPNRFTRAKQATLQGLLAQRANPAAVLRRAFARLAFAGHPYGRQATPESVGSITPEDLRAYHARWFHPEGFILAVAGDFRKAEMVAALEGAFAGWERAPDPLPKDPPPFERAYRGGHYVVPMPGVTQTNIRIGHWGPRALDPDAEPLEVMNLVLGGGSFWSRFTKIIRTKEGLAYSVGSGMPSFNQGGLFLGVVQTKAETSYRAIGLMKDLIGQIRDEPIPAEDLAQARDSIVNSFLQRFENPAGLAAQYAQLEFRGFPPDHFERYLARVRAVTVEDVQRVAREYLRPEGLEIVLVGDPALFDSPPEGSAPPKTLPNQ